MRPNHNPETDHVTHPGYGYPLHPVVEPRNLVSTRQIEAVMDAIKAMVQTHPLLPWSEKHDIGMAIAGLCREFGLPEPDCLQEESDPDVCPDLESRFEEPASC